MPFALPQLDILLAALLALGVCLLVVAFSKAFFGVAGTLLGKLPVVGGWLDATAHHIEQRITNVFGGFAVKLEGVVGASWHGMARIVDKIGHEIAAHAGLLATLATGLPGFGTVITVYREIQKARALATRVLHLLQGIGHDIAPRVKVIERGIGEDVLPRVKGLEREVGRVITHDIPGLRAGERAAEREISNLWRWTRHHPLAAGTAAFSAAVALALAKLGLSWIRCPTANQVFKKRGCNMWTDLDGLLAAAVGVAASLSLVELAKAEQEIVGDLSTVVRDFWQV